MANVKLTELIIRSLASDGPFRRGEAYFQDGAVSDLVQRGETLERLARDSGAVRLTFRMKPPMRLLRRMYRVVTARQESEGTHVSQAIHCERRPLLSWMFDVLAVTMLRTNFQRSLQKLKTLVESEASPSGVPAAAEHEPL